MYGYFSKSESLAYRPTHIYALLDGTGSDIQGEYNIHHFQFYSLVTNA